MDPSGTAAQIGWFAAIGTASAASYALLYLLFRYFLTPAWANALALATTAVVNTAANRRLTFKVRGTQDALRHHAQGFSVFVVGLAVTLGALRVLHLLQLGDNALIEVLTLTGANLCVTVARFVLMRSWIFRPPPR